MKFLQINENDDELFNVDLKLFKQFKDKLDVTEKDNFLIMYGTQGKTFWLQFILTFRHNYYSDHFIKEIEAFKGHCVSDILEVVESAFISIHKRYVEDGCDPLKLMRIIIMYIYFIMSFSVKLNKASKEKCSVTYSNVEIKFIEQLVKDFKHYDKSLFVKCLFATRCYARFFMCICNLLQKYKLAEEVSKTSLKNNPNKNYWHPFNIWNNENFMPSFFEKYLVSHYGKKLQNMLSLSPVTLKIFESRQIDHFCSVSENIESSESEIKEDRLVYLRKQCRTHSNCWERIFHDKGCKNPYNCFSCLLSCDTVLEQKINITSEGILHFWRNCSVSFYPSVVKGHRDAMIQTETLFISTEKYICVDSAEVHFYVKKKPKKPCNSSPLVTHIPAEMTNTFDQLQHEFIVKYRLREKLGKKEEKYDFTTQELVNPILRKAIKCMDDKVLLHSDNEYSKNYAYLFFIFPFLQTNISPVILNNPSVISVHTRDVGVYCNALTYQQVLKANVPVKSKANNMVFSLVYEGYKKLFPGKKYSNGQSSSNESIPENKIVCRKDACTNTDEQYLNSITHISHNQDSQDAAIESIYYPFIPEQVISELDCIQCFDTEGETENGDTASMDFPSEQTSESSGLDLSENRREDKMEDEKVEEFFSLIRSGCNDEDVSTEKEDASTEKEDASTEKEDTRSATALDSVSHERHCFYCGMIEVQKKSFKKCAQCKKEKFEPMHYYCSKECQKEDWLESHKKDHSLN